MSKFYGPVGYIEEIEEVPDVIVPRPVERYYKGDLLKNNRRLENGSGTADDITLGNRISIMADAYAYNHYFLMRYVKWRGAAWKVTDVEEARPRLILTLGGLYNGETAD